MSKIVEKVEQNEEIAVPSVTARLRNRVSLVLVVLATMISVPGAAFATTGADTTVSQVFDGVQTLFTGSVVPAVVLFFAAKIGLIMATAYASKIATSNKA